MTTYGEIYGKTRPTLVDDWEAPPDESQFENPIASGKIAGRKPTEMPKLNLDSILPNREVKEVKFTELSEDKQLKVVAEEYNQGKSTANMCKELGIGPGTLYKHIHKAVDAGLIRQLRSGGKVKQAEPAVKKEDIAVHGEDFIGEIQTGFIDGGNIKPATVTAEDFEHAILQKRDLADKLELQVERLIKASKIAEDLTELLGDEAGDLVNSLYVRVS